LAAPPKKSSSSSSFWSLASLRSTGVGDGTDGASSFSSMNSASLK